MSKEPKPPDHSNLKPYQRQAIRQLHLSLQKFQDDCATKGGNSKIARVIEDLEAEFPFVTED